MSMKHCKYGHLKASQKKYPDLKVTAPKQQSNIYSLAGNRRCYRFCAQTAKLYHLGASTVSRSSLTRVNEKQPSSRYETLFAKGLTSDQPFN